MVVKESGPDGRLASRLNHLEGDLSGVKTDVAGLKTDVGYIRHHLDSLASTIHELNRSISERNRTDWKTIISGVALIVTIGTLAIAPLYRGLTSLLDDYKTHIRIDGHAPMVERVKALEAAKKQLDDVLQREMRLLDDTAEERVRAQDEVLQREIQLNREVLEERLKALSKRVDKIENEQSRRTSKVYKVQ